MASIRADSHEIPLVHPLREGEFVVVSSHLLYVRFGFNQSNIYVEEEVMSKIGILKESIHILNLEVDSGHTWHLCPGHFRAYGLPSRRMCASNNIFLHQSDYSTVNMPLVQEGIWNSLEREHTLVTSTLVLIVHVKQEVPSSIIDISSESEGKSPSQPNMQHIFPKRVP